MNPTAHHLVSHQLRAEALARARDVLASARAESGAHRQHRGLRVSPLAWRPLATSVLLGAALMGALLALSGPLLALWRDVMLTWAAALDIPLRAGTGSQLFGWVGPQPSARPDGPLGLALLATVLLLLVASGRLPDRMTPVKYFVRIVCLVQLGSMLLFFLIPERFAHTVEDHLNAVLWSGWGVMTFGVFLLCCAQGVLRVPARTVMLHALLFLGYFVLMLPHKAVLHALILQHLSVLLMPLLYFWFGVLFDVVVLNALFAWMVSETPQPRPA
jgi:hypothetical protein